MGSGSLFLDRNFPVPGIKPFCKTDVQQVKCTTNNN